MRVVIMGSGRTGSLLADMLDRASHEVSLIDWDSSSFSRVPDTFSGRMHTGNGLDEDVLRAAGIEQADVFVAATSGDNRNVMASQIAEQVFRVPRVIMRIKDPIRADIFTELGIQVDSRTARGADTILSLLED